MEGREVGRVSKLHCPDVVLKYTGLSGGLKWSSPDLAGNSVSYNPGFNLGTVVTLLI
jgi:hypothetical protein